MPKHNVHIFVPMRVKMYNVEAPDIQSAAKRARELADFYTSLPDNSTGDETVAAGFPEGHVELCGWAEDEPIEYLVDVVGDDDYSLSERFDGEFKPIKWGTP